MRKKRDIQEVDTVTVGATALSELLSITPQHLASLARQGIIPKDGRGAYPLRDCVRGYASYLRVRKIAAQLGRDVETVRRVLLEHYGQT